MNANTQRLMDERDEAQSQARGLETDVRILRARIAALEAALAEATAIVDRLCDGYPRVNGALDARVVAARAALKGGA